MIAVPSDQLEQVFERCLARETLLAALWQAVC